MIVIAVANVELATINGCWVSTVMLTFVVGMAGHDDYDSEGDATLAMMMAIDRCHDDDNGNDKRDTDDHDNRGNSDVDGNGDGGVGNDGGDVGSGDAGDSGVDVPCQIKSMLALDSPPST